jgi:aspartyl/asparaginyl-tRNA synthetase
MAFRKNNILFLAFESEVNEHNIEKLKREELQRLFDLDAKIKVLSCWAPYKKFDNFREELEKHILGFLSDRKFDGVFGLLVYTDDCKKFYMALYSNDIDKKCKIIHKT